MAHFSSHGRCMTTEFPTEITKKKEKKSKCGVYLQLTQWSRGGWQSEPQKGAASLPPPCRRDVGEYSLFFGRASIKTSFSSWSVFTAKASASVLDFAKSFHTSVAEAIFTSHRSCTTGSNCTCKAGEYLQGTCPCNGLLRPGFTHRASSAARRDGETH